MQRLFRILDTKTQKFEQDRFENKMEAKKVRNDLNSLLYTSPSPRDRG